MQFAVRPLFKSNESRIGYVLRLAKRNGYLRLSGLLPQPTIQRLVKNEKSKVRAIDTLLPHSTRIEPISVSTPLLRKPHSLRPRVCLSCIKEHGYLSAQHQNPFVYECHEHNEALIDTCPHCYHSLTWDIGLLDGRCTNLSCQQKLAPVSHQITQPLSKQDIADCILAGIFSRNPNKLYIQTSTWAEFSHLHSLIETGYKLLTEPELMKTWLLESSRYFDRSLPASFRTIPASLLHKHLGSKRWSALSLLSHSSNYLSPSNPVTTPIVAHADTIMALTGFRFYELKRLQSLTLIHSNSGSKLMKSSIIDVSPFLRALTKSPNRVKGETLLSHSSFILKNGVSIGAVLEAIATDQLKANIRASADLLSSLNIEQHVLIEYLQQKGQQARPHKLTLNQAIKITGLSAERLKQLQDKGVINKPSWYQDGCRHFCVYQDIVKLQSNHGTKQYSFKLDT
jgi:hypothetical protein